MAGDDTQSVCCEQHQMTEAILDDKKHDSTFYPVIYGMGVDEDWMDEAAGERLTRQSA
jgi:phage terminase large subunit-like protein